MSEQVKISGDFEQGTVPQEARRGFWSMLVVMLGFTFFSASMFAGGKLGAGMSFKGFMASVLVGNLLLGAYTGTLAYMAAKTGASLHILSRYAFGRQGSYIPSFIMGITQVGWFGVGVAMFAIPVQKYFIQLGWGNDSRLLLWAIVLISGALMTITAYFGIKSLTILSFFAVPAIIVLGCWSSGVALFGNEAAGWQKLIAYQPSAESAIGLSAAIAVSIGSFISGGTCTPDFVRFSKTAKVATWTTVIAFFLGNSLMFFFGAAGTMVHDKADISDVLALQGLLVFAIVALGLNIWTTNDNAIYTSGLGFSNITGIPKRFTVLFNGALGTIAGLWLYDNFIGFLNFLNTIIPPVGAVLIADFFFNRKKYQQIEDCNFGNIRVPAVVAWLAGSAVAFVPFGVTAINGMVVSALVYIALCALFKSNKDK